MISCGSNTKNNETDNSIDNDIVAEEQKQNDSMNIKSPVVISENQSSDNLFDSLTNWTNTFKNHQIGYLTIGDSVTHSIKRLSIDFNVTYDSIEACVGCFDEFEYYYRIKNSSNETVFTVHPGQEENNIGLIQHIKLYDKTYKSDKGIGIGNTANDLKEKYNVSEAYFDYENGLFFFASDFKGSFRFDCCMQDKYQDINFENPSIEVVPDDMVVDMIVIL